MDKVGRAEFLERLREQEPRACAEFVRAHQSRVYRVIFRLLGDAAEAEDVAQDVFVAAFKSIGNFRGDAKIETWLFRIATNLAYNRIKYLKRRAQGKKKSFDEHEERVHSGRFVSSPPSPDAVVAGHQLQQALQKALLTLSEEHRTLLILRDVEDLSYGEIAQISELEVGTVKSRLHRARMTLRKKMEELRGETS